MNYEAERAMNQKRLRMEGEPGHGVVQGNGLPLNYMDNGHQIPYQPYAGAYNTHYPPPDAFAAYGPPPPGGYAPQNLSYAPPAHQNYPHHQSFPPQQPPQAQLHMPQSHMVQGYGDVGMHKPVWPPQPHLLPPLDTQKPLDVKQLKPEIKLEPTDPQKRPHPESELMGSDLDAPKIKIKTDIFKPDDPQHPQHRIEVEIPHDVSQKPMEVVQKPAEGQIKDDAQPIPGIENKSGEKPAEASKPDEKVGGNGIATPLGSTEKKEGDIKRESFSSPDRPNASVTPGKSPSSGLEPKKRGRPKGSTNKPKPPGSSPAKPLLPNAPNAMSGVRGPPALPKPAQIGRPRGTGYQYAIRPFRKDFSGIQFRRRWSDDCLESSHIPNEVYFGDVPVPLEVLHNYYDANAERDRLAAQAAAIAAHKAQARPPPPAARHAEVTTVDSSSSDSSSSGSEDSESDEDQPLKRGPGRPKGSKAAAAPRAPGGGRRGRPPVPRELREPGVVEMKKFCKAAGIRFDYKKLVEGCTKNKERVAKMMELLIASGLEGKPTLEKCQAIKQAKQDKKEEEKRVKKEAKIKPERANDGLEGKSTLKKCQAIKQDKKEEEKRVKKEAKVKPERANDEDPSTRRMTRGATGVKPRQKIVISSDEEDDTPSARRTLSKLRDMLDDESDSD